MQNTTNTPNSDIKKVTTVENAKENKESLKNKAGEAIEKVGHKIAEAGMPKVGQKIHDIGDSMEDQHDNKSHPHKV